MSSSPRCHWLRRCGIRSVAMESTSVYWNPVYQILESRGMEVCLVNAQHVKNGTLPSTCARSRGPHGAQTQVLRCFDPVVDSFKISLLCHPRIDSQGTASRLESTRIPRDLVPDQCDHLPHSVIVVCIRDSALSFEPKRGRARTESAPIHRQPDDRDGRMSA